MAATGSTPIKLYGTNTASQTPLAANLANDSGGIELAVNGLDGKLFYKDNSGNVQVLASKATGAIGGSTTQVQFNNAGVLGGSASLTWSGTVLTSSGFSGPLNGTVGATTANTGNFTTLTTSSTITDNGGTANGVAYLNGSKVLTTGSALTFNGTTLAITGGQTLSGVLNLSSANQMHQLSGHNFVQGDANTTYLYGGASGGIQLRSSNNASALVTFADSLTTYTSPVTFNSAITLGAISSFGTNLVHTIGGHNFVQGDAGNTYIYGGTSGGQIRSSDNTLQLLGWTDAGVFTWLPSGTEGMRLTSTGLGIGTSTPSSKLHATIASATAYTTSSRANVLTIQNTTAGGYAGIEFLTEPSSGNAGIGGINAFNSASGDSVLAFSTRGSATLAERMRIDSSGNLLVGTTSVLAANRRLNVVDSGGIPAIFKQASSSANECLDLWNSATSGNNVFVEFQTDAGVARGTITYNRAAGLVAYNTTSDYRAKDISGPVTGSGSLIDSVPVYMGTMKGATQERPMFIAHEVPAYAHTGEKDAVDADGNPIYQQMDASALVPVMWAEIQSLRKRLADAGI